VARRPVRGHAGVGFSFINARPLPYGQFAAPVALLDAKLTLRWWFLELGLDAFNLTNSQYAAIEYSFASDWHTRPALSTPVRHLAAGAPLRLLGTVALLF
jgi:hypothetical protein